MTNVAANRERHVAGLGRDIQLRKQMRELWVGGFVVHDEPRVEMDRTTFGSVSNRMAVTTEVVVSLVEDDVVGLREQVGADEAANTSPNYRNPQDGTSWS